MSNIQQEYGVVMGWVHTHPWLTGIIASGLANLIGVIFRV